VQLLRQRQVAAYADLAQQLEVSRKTVQRALGKAGAYASLNGNSAYVTLKNTPRFDRRGLWGYQQLRFSRHGDLPRTIQALVEQSSQGCTLEELQQWLGTRVHNHLSRLLRRSEIQRFFLGRHAIYTISGATIGNRPGTRCDSPMASATASTNQSRGTR
jgi:DNA-binding transcriptional regulator YhcF (GntR family)